LCNFALRNTNLGVFPGAVKTIMLFFLNGASNANRVQGFLMKYAIITDIHANLEALTTVLSHAKGQDCAEYVFLGDFVGYNSDPKACIEIVRALNAPCVKGNHDQYASTNDSLIDFNPVAAHAMEWTRKQLSEDDRNWLRHLPYVRNLEHFTMVHATLLDPHRWSYILDKVEAEEHFTFQQSQLCFYGHTHVALVFIRDSTSLRAGTYSKLKIQPETRYLFNPGSAGQSRDVLKKATYATFDTNTRAIELHRLDYNVAETQRKNRAAGLPFR
jgi:predicted phosphodiesterase